MLTYEQAKEIGKEACIDRLGRDFVMKYRDTACPAFSDLDDRAYCFVGVDNSDDRYDYSNVTLDSTSKWPFSVECTVKYDNGAIEFLDCVVPA